MCFSCTAEFLVLLAFLCCTCERTAAAQCHAIGSDNVFYDESCAHGGVGCNAGGQGQNCRFCKAAPGRCNGGGSPGNQGPPAASGGDGRHRFTFKNQCPFTVWVGALGKTTPQGGGWRLNSHDSNTIELPDHWQGRFWGRTNCVNGACETGDCGHREQCGGAGGQPPATLAEFTLNGAGGLDFYDVSLVDGYNLPMRIATVPGTWVRTNGGKYDCTTAGCNSDLNTICPPELRVQKNGATVACKSACEAFNTDVYCCRGAHNQPQTCKSAQWPVNYPSVFKRACPDAYSYAYDDLSSTFTCKGNPAVSYEITFCP